MNRSVIGTQGEWQELVPILVGVYPLHQDLLYVLVGSFYCAVQLRIVRNKIPVFDLELLAKLLDHFSIQVFSIINNELSWYVIVANDVLFQELAHHNLGNAFVGDGFHPLSEVIDGHQNILMPIGGFRNHGSDDIHSLG